MSPDPQTDESARRKAGDRPSTNLSTLGLWWRHFNYSTGSKWVPLAYMTVAAVVLAWFIRPLSLIFLVTGGPTVTGTVLRDGYQGTYTGGWVYYRYDDQHGQRHFGRASVSGYEVHFLWGDPVKVQYLAFAPGVSWLPQKEDQSRTLTLSTLFVAFVVAPLAWLWFVNGYFPGRDALRHVRAVRWGTAALGRVTGRQEMDDQNGLSVSIAYRFCDRAGEQWAGKYIFPSLAPAAQWQVGTPVLVLYELNHPARHDLDLFGARQADLTTLLADGRAG